MDALKPCKACGHLIAPSARVCPSCGVSEPGVEWWVKPVVWIVVIGLVLIGVKNCLSQF